jgi:DNA-binding transcriptional regulator PaaX
VTEKENPDGTITIILTDKGKQKALTYDFGKMEIKKPQKWDKKWRVVLFDIPENRKKIRDALRYHLKNLGFYEFQKSVFVHPYDCKDEIDYLIEFYDIRRFVRFIIADSLDNELHLKKHFNLL